MRHRFPGWRQLAAILASFALLTATMAGITYQQAIAQDDMAAAHPAHIHVGSCDAPGDVVAPLSDVGDQYLADGEPTENVEVAGQSGAVAVVASASTVELPLADILAGDHAIVVHESAENIANYIACGNIGGNLLDGLDIQFGLTELNDSGMTGVAWLADNGDGTTTVFVFLHSGEMADMADTAASGDDEQADGGGAAVDIVEFTFDPATVEVKVGDTVTWTNQDGVPHTATQNPSGSGFQSGAIQGGESYSFTFEEAGEFAYFCEFHPNMSGTIVVTE